MVSYLSKGHWVWVLLNGISTSVGHLMPRKVRLVLSSTRVLGYGVFFNSSWFYLARYWWKGWFLSDFSERVRFLEASKCSQVWFGWFYGIKKTLQATQCQTLFMCILNQKLTNEYLVDNIPNEPQPTCQDTKLMAPSIAAIQHQQFNPTSMVRLHIVKWHMTCKWIYDL